MAFVTYHVAVLFLHALEPLSLFFTYIFYGAYINAVLVSSSHWHNELPSSHLLIAVCFWTPIVVAADIKLASYLSMRRHSHERRI